MNIKVKNRFQAFAVHLTISLFIFVGFLSVMFLWWYPSPYFEAEAGWDVLGILIVVDVVLGPSLTLIVFKLGKPSLKFDLSVIACVQLLALLYGGQIIYEQRPAFLVFAEDQAYLVSRNDVDMTLVDESILKQMDGKGPFPVYAKMPDDAGEILKFFTEMFTKGKPGLGYRTEYYEPMLPNLKAIMSADKGIALFREKSDKQSLVESFVTSHKDKLDGYAFIPLVGRKKDVLLVIDKLSGSVVDALDVNPWIKPN